VLTLTINVVVLGSGSRFCGEGEAIFPVSPRFKTAVYNNENSMLSKSSPSSSSSSAKKLYIENFSICRGNLAPAAPENAVFAKSGGIQSSSESVFVNLREIFEFLRAVSQAPSSVFSL
jgi:hypothetical protein